MKKILVMRVSAIGDVVHTFPAIFLLHALLPGVKISWVVQKKVAGLLTGQPFLDKVWVLEDQFLSPKNWLKTARIVYEIRQTKWDAIIDFQGLVKTSLILSMLKGPIFGFAGGHGREWIASLCVKHPVVPEYTHIIQKNLFLACEVAQHLMPIASCPTFEAITQAALLPSLKYQFYKATTQQVDAWLNQYCPAPFVILVPNTTWPSKHWPEVCWEELCVKLSAISDRAGRRVNLLLVGKGFGAAADGVVAFCLRHRLPVVVTPGWDLQTISYVISKASVVVAPDTGLLHLADFLGVKTVGIFGPTRKVKHGPFSSEQNRASCFQIECPHSYQKTHGKNQNAGISSNCMYKLTPDTVSERVRALLG